MKKFEIGNTYTMHSPCMQDCIWSYTVANRTAKSVTVVDENGKSINLRINQKVSEYFGTETVYPLGKYSMCPSLHA